MNFQMFKLDLEEAEEPENKLPTSVGSSRNREFQKNICFCLVHYAKAFYCADRNKLENSSRDGILDHFTFLLTNVYVGQEATIRTGHGTTDWFQIGKEIHQGYILSPCLFNLYTEYIIRNTGLDEVQVESRLLGEISIMSDMQMTPPLWQKVKKNQRASW